MPVSFYKSIYQFPVNRTLVLLALPISFLIISAIMRYNAGPFWLWSNLDPDYWYLTDSLNMINGEWPKHIWHPGTTVQWIGALIIKISHPFSSPDDLKFMVLRNPEHYLSIIGFFFIALNTAALILVGTIGYMVFRDLSAALLIQMGPFLSKLIFKWTLHVSPEPLLVTTVIALATITVLALRDGQLEKHGTRYAMAFAIIAGFGMVTKITSAGIYLMPIVLLWNIRNVALYGVLTVVAMLLFSLPAAGMYETFIDRVTMVALASGFHGEGAQTFIDLNTYPDNLIRVSSRPMFFVVLFVGLSLTYALFRKSRLERQPFPVIGRALGGLCLAYIGQAMLVAKHPAGHYMLPALAASGLGLALIYQTSKELLRGNVSKLKILRAGFTLLLLILIGTQTNSLIGLNKQFSQRAASSAAIDEAPYKQCARIYFWPASHPIYALFMGSWNTHYSFSDELYDIYSDQSELYYTNDGELHYLRGLRDPKSLINQYTCIYARGANPHASLKILDDAFSSYPTKGRCRDGDEAVFTWGIDCTKFVN
jgi:hypothetical protein